MAQGGLCTRCLQPPAAHANCAQRAAILKLATCFVYNRQPLSARQCVAGQCRGNANARPQAQAGPPPPQQAAIQAYRDSHWGFLRCH
jgi:hypothetical protein